MPSPGRTSSLKAFESGARGRQLSAIDNGEPGIRPSSPFFVSATFLRSTAMMVLRYLERTSLHCRSVTSCILVVARKPIGPSFLRALHFRIPKMSAFSDCSKIVFHQGISLDIIQLIGRPRLKQACRRIFVTIFASCQGSTCATNPTTLHMNGRSFASKYSALRPK